MSARKLERAERQVDGEGQEEHRPDADPEPRHDAVPLPPRQRKVDASAGQLRPDDVLLHLAHLGHLLVTFLGLALALRSHCLHRDHRADAGA